MGALDDQARAAGEAKRQAVRRKMLESRSRAPRLYVKALLLHHTLTGSMPPNPILAQELEALVLHNERAARDVLGALEWAIADGGRYEGIVSALHSMLARRAAREVVDEIERGMR